MVKVVSSVMVKFTKVTMLMTKNMGLVLLVGPMAECIVGSGKMANKMVKDNIIYLMEIRKLDYGLTEKELDGFKIVKYELLFQYFNYYFYFLIIFKQIYLLFIIIFY